MVSLSVKREYDDGRLEYEVKFWVDTTEYEYTVDGATGDIRKSEREPHPSASSADIGQDQASTSLWPMLGSPSPRIL